MAMLDKVFVNIGICGSHESAEGLGAVSFSGVRNFLKHDWPQMDIGEIEFYNPRVATDEGARNRRLTRNQAYWLANKLAAYANTLTIPDEDKFDQTQEHGQLRLEEDEEFKPQRAGAGDHELYIFNDGSVIRRHYGEINLPVNAGVPIEADGQWVLFNKEGEALDRDKYLDDGESVRAQFRSHPHSACRQ